MCFILGRYECLKIRYQILANLLCDGLVPPKTPDLPCWSLRVCALMMLLYSLLECTLFFRNLSESLELGISMHGWVQVRTCVALFLFHLKICFCLCLYLFWKCDFPVCWCQSFCVFVKHWPLYMCSSLCLCLCSCPFLRVCLRLSLCFICRHGVCHYLCVCVCRCCTFWCVCRCRLLIFFSMTRVESFVVKTLRVQTMSHVSYVVVTIKLAYWKSFYFKA